MLMKVAEDRRLENAKHASDLPASWYTLYKLSTLDDEEFDAVEPHLSPDLKRSEIPKLLPDESSENGTEPERRPEPRPRAAGDEARGVAQPVSPSSPSWSSASRSRRSRVGESTP